MSLKDIPNVIIKTKEGLLDYFKVSGSIGNTIRDYSIRQNIDGLAEVTITFVATKSTCFAFSVI